MKGLIALAAALGLVAAACGGAQIPIPPVGEPTPQPPAPTAQPPAATPAPPALGGAQLEALARAFVPPGMTDETTVEAASVYQMHGRSQMSIDQLDAHWRQVAEARGMRIEFVSKSDDMLAINMTGAGIEWITAGAVTRGHGIDVSVIVSRE